MRLTNLKKIAIEAVEAEAKVIIKEATLQMEAQSKLNAPVDTGALRRGIHSTIGELEGKVETSPDTPYAVEVEEGHYTKSGCRVGGQKFMAKAYEKTHDDASKKLEKAAEDIINEIMKGVKLS